MTLSSDNTFDTPDSGAAPQRPRRLLPWLIAGLVALLAVLYLLPVTVSGVVRNAAGAALPDVRIDLGNGQSTQSDANGAFRARSSRLKPLQASVDEAAYLPWQGAARFGLLPLVPAALPVQLDPTRLQGVVVNALDNQPVAGAQITAAGQTVITGSDGRFELTQLPRDAADVALSGAGFIASQLTLSDWAGNGSQLQTLAIYPNALHGTVSDGGNGEPLPAAVVTFADTTATTLANGFYYLVDAAAGGTISVTLPGFLPAVLVVQDEAELSGAKPVDVALEPTALNGVVTDGKTGQPLAGVALTAGDQSAVSDAQGRYRLERLHGTALQLAGTLEGYEPGAQAINETRNLLGGEPLDFALLPPHLAGRLLNQVTNKPVAGATVTAGNLSAVSDAEGRFILWTTDLPLNVAVNAPGYEAAQSQFTADEELALALEPKGVVVQINDAAGQPVSGARIVTLRSEAETDAQGIALLPLLEAGDVYTVTAANFAPVRQSYDGMSEIGLALSPDTVAGTVADVTGAAVPGAVIYVYDGTQCQGMACRGTTPLLMQDAAADGTFTVTGLPAQPQLMIKAPGYALYFPDALGAGDCGAPYCLDAQMEPFAARGFYVPFHFLYDRALIQSRLDLAVQSDALNAVVVDMKSDYGEIAWQPQNAIAQEINIYQADIMGAQEFLAAARERGIYTIARFVTFKDNALAEGRPEWALRLRSNPTVLWKDGEDLSWADPYLPEVRQYEIDLAKELAALGFDEIQFDYFRFSGLRDHNIMTYSVESTPENRRETITNFSRDLMAALKPYGVFTSIDVFGSIILNGNEPFIGQNLADMSVGLDYLSPMIYPQVWWPGTFPGCDEPVQCPYKVIYDSTDTVREIVPLPTRIRPWLQGYAKNFRTSGPAAGYDYAVPEMMIQRQAADDAGAEGWLFWSGGGRYPDEIFGPMPSLAELEAQIRIRQGGRSGPY